MFSKIAVFTSLAVVAFAQNPTGPQNGPAITKPLNEDINCGEVFTITWTPTDANKDSTVSLDFMKGPPENVIKQESIAQNIPNTGSYEWTVPEGYESSTVAAKGYGLRIIVSKDQSFEFSTQIGYKCANSGRGTTTTDYGSSTTTDYATETETETETYAPPTNETTTLTTATSVPSYGNETTVVPEPTDDATEPTEALPTPSGDSGAVSLKATFGLVMGALLVAFTV